MKKYIPISAMLLIGAVLLCAILRCSPPVEKEVETEIMIRIDSDSAEAIRLWQDQDNEIYVFLPSYARLSECTWSIPSGTDIRLDGIAVYNGDSLAVDLDRDYEISIGTKSSSVRFVQSSGVATLYLSAEYGALQRIAENKKTKIPINMLLLDANGNVDYQSSGRDKLRGHGNATFGYPKKPYNLYLSAPAGLLGSPSGSNWILLANYIDQSNVRNAVTFDIAKDTSDIWTPETHFVDMYVNGEYQGLYLLTERVEAGPNRLQLEPDDILLNFEYTFRAADVRIEDILKSAFDTGISAEPRYIASGDADRWQKADTTIHKIFSDLQSHSIPEGSLDSCFDLDSWAWLYIIQEITQNFDSGGASLFFILRGNKLYASSVWDYDNTFGQNSMYDISYLEGYSVPLWKNLLQYPEFRQKVQEMYSQTFKQIIFDLPNRIAHRYSEVETAVGMDELRWKRPTFLTTYSLLQDFVSQRIPILDQHLGQEIPFCQINIMQFDECILHYSIPQGARFSDFHDTSGMSWKDYHTREAFDPDTPVYADTDLEFIQDSIKQDSSDIEATHLPPAAPHKKAFSSRLFTLLIFFFIMGIFGTAFLLLSVRQIMHYPKEDTPLSHAESISEA